jgi:hypothetical protein
MVPSSPEQYELTIKIGEEVFLQRSIPPGVTTTGPIPLVGSGSVVYDLYINGEKYDSVEVVFDPDE